MKLIVGLGNPGKTYTYTRHNIGFLVIERLAEIYGGRFQKACDGLIARVNIEDQPCSLLMPQTMMNNSGISVKSAMVKLGVDMKDVLIVYDDMSIHFDTLRIKPSGSAGGHNGIKSIITHLGSNDFARLRLGVGKKPLKADAADYVLANFTSSEKKSLPDFINKASLGALSWVTRGVDATMNEFNSNSKPKDPA